MSDVLLYSLKGHLRSFLTTWDSYDRMLTLCADGTDEEEFTEIVDDLFRETLDSLDFPRLLTATLGECDECKEQHEVNEDEVRTFIDEHVEHARELILFMFRKVLSDDALALCSDRIDGIKKEIEKQLFGKKDESEDPSKEPKAVHAVNVVDLWNKRKGPIT